MGGGVDVSVGRGIGVIGVGVGGMVEEVEKEV